jgi:hypothetical protein
LIFALTLPRFPSLVLGMWTHVSRGIDTSCALLRSAARCSTMMVSLREPPVGLFGSRESLPSTSTLIALRAAGARAGRCSSGTESNTLTRSTSFSTERA